jgi:hypothetical protein
MFASLVNSVAGSCSALSFDAAHLEILSDFGSETSNHRTGGDIDDAHAEISGCANLDMPHRAPWSLID